MNNINLLDRWDAEDFLIEKGISNHPIVSDCNNKESYEVADLMVEFTNDNIRRILIDFGLWLDKNDRQLENGNITESVDEFLGL